MNFVHDDPDFARLLGIVARDTGISEALIEKDYWVTHTLWALHETGLEIWFKGGTSLSKGFGLIQRFSEYLGHYPGIRQQQLVPAMSPFVRLEVGHARVIPHVVMPLKSFVHDHLSKLNMLGEYQDNRPQLVRCVHPLMTLFEKLDAMARRFERDTIEPASFVRHYEDAAQIIGSIEKLPKISMTAHELAQDMVACKDIRTLPHSDDAALNLEDGDKRVAIENAYARTAPMFWGGRIALDEACSSIRLWLSRQTWNL